MLYPEFPGPGKDFCRNLSEKGLYQPFRSWLGFLLTYQICSRFVFKWFSSQSTVIGLFVRHCTFSHCLLIQSDSSVDSARFCSCTPCLQVFQKQKGLGNNEEAEKDQWHRMVRVGQQEIRSGSSFRYAPFAHKFGPFWASRMDSYPTREHTIACLLAFL